MRFLNNLLIGVIVIIHSTEVLSQNPVIYPNFPIVIDSFAMNTFFSAAPILADLDWDGRLEIITTANDQNPAKLYVIKQNATNFPGFPKNLPYYPFRMACGDVDGNGDLDIVIRYINYLTVLNKFGNDLPGFPLFFQDAMQNSRELLSIYDLDGDGKLEIIINGSGGRVGVFNYNGSMRAGWPVTLPGQILGTAAVGDLDNDGFAEIAVGSAIILQPSPTIAESSKVNIYRHNGQIFPDWPVYNDSNYIPSPVGPTLFINRNYPDSTLIYVNTWKWINPPYSKNRISVYDVYGNLKFRTVLITYNPLQGIVPADMNNDFRFEICTGNQDPQLYLYSYNCILFSNWPQAGYGTDEATPIIGKIIPGNPYKIIANSNRADPVSGNGYIYGYNMDGTQLPWSPLRPLGVIFSMSLADLNNDGSVELVAVSGQYGRTYLHVYSFPGISFSRENFPWTMLAHDRYRTNQYGFVPPDEPIGIKPISTNIPDDFELYQNYPNPFNTNSKIKFQISKLIETELIIYDVLGREITTLVNEQLKPGTYEVDFDGTNFTTGVYFYVLKTDNYRAVKKMTLLK